MINHFFRNYLRTIFGVMAALISWDNKFQRMKFRKRYAFYYGKNGIGNFPITDFEGQKERLQQTVSRTKNLQKIFFRSIITLTRHIPGQKTIFVFSSLATDEGKEPSYLQLLQSPYRYLHTKEGRALIERVGELTAQVMVLAITQPRFLYATDPSTLTTFLKELDCRWKEVRVRMKNIPPGLMRLSDSNGERLMMTFLIREKAPTIKELLPDLQAVISWDGGDVKTFVDQLKASLPGVKFLPMYSMSKKALETLPHRIGDKIHFFPVVPGAYPEFQDTETEKIYDPFHLVPERSYVLILSDERGLRRYDTGDIFYVNGIIEGIPDLAFLRRKGM